MALLKCLVPIDADYMLREIYEGIYGNHIGARTLATKALRVGYFWPTMLMLQDAKQYVTSYDKCQRHALLVHQPANELSPICNPLPFAQ